MIEAGRSGTQMLSRHEILTLVEAGIRAPSADNCHIIRFESDALSLRLRVVSDALQGVPPHRILFHEFAFGAVIENIMLRAAQLGRMPSLHVNNEWRRDLTVAEIQLPLCADVPIDPLATAIPARTTNRRLYNRRRAAGAVLLDELSNATALVSDVRVHWLDKPPLRRQAVELIRIAESERFRHERLHAELFEAIRFDVGWHSGADAGLPPGTLQIEPPFRPVFEAIRKWPLQRRLNRLGAAALLGLRAGWLPAMTAPHLALLSVARSSDRRMIQAGRALQRLWLAATQHSIAMQPMAASIALANQHPDDCWASPLVCARVSQELDELADGRRPIMLFRLGYAQKPSLRAGRLGVTSYMTDVSR